MPDRTAEPTESRWDTFDNLDRLFLAAVCAGAVGIFQLVVKIAAWPLYEHSEASLLASRDPAEGWAAVVLGLGVSVVLATVLLRRLRHEAGLFAACVGMATLANRGGTVSALLRDTQNPAVYRTLILETVLLFAVLLAAWQLLSLPKRRGWLAREPSPAPAPAGRRLAATCAQAIVTGLLLLLLARADNQKQVMASVLVASLVGSVAACQMFPVGPSAWFWAGPFLTAAFGYAWALRAPGNWSIGQPANPLAAVSPLGYASLGAAGAIFGYWVGREWAEAR